jgi:hypothetical protein
MKKSKTRYGYMCWVDFDVELGEETPDAKAVFSTLEELKEKRPCVSECGWVKVRITAVEHSGHKTAAEIVEAAK